MNIGFVGLGNMGEPMAALLLKAGHRVTVYNRTREKAAPLESQGARIAGSPREAAAGAEAVISMLADDTALREVTFGDEGVSAGLARGAALYRVARSASAWRESSPPSTPSAIRAF